MSAEEDEGPYSMTDADLIGLRTQYGKLGPQIYAGFIACLSAISFGTVLGWSSPVTYESYSTSTDGVDSRDLSLLASMVALGCALGFITWPYAMSRMGPRKALQNAGIFYVVTWGCTTIPADGIALASRFFLGFLGISRIICGEALMMETVHTGLGKYFMIAVTTAVPIGVLLTHSLGFLMPKLWLTIVCGVIPIVTYGLIWPVPESPLYLYEFSEKRAAESMAWYRGPNNIYLDMKKIRKAFEYFRIDPDAYRYMLYSKVVRKAVIRVVILSFVQVASGYFIFMFYNIYVWNNRKAIENPFFDSTLVALWLCISKLFWELFHIKKRPRVRVMVITSCFSVAIVLTLLAVYLALDFHGIQLAYDHNWVPFLLIGLIIFFTDMGLNHYPLRLIYEYVPYQVYKRAHSILNVTGWFCIFLKVYMFGRLTLDYPSYYVIGGMALVLYLGTLFSYLCVVETRNRSLVQIQLKIGGNPVGNRTTLYTRIENIQLP